MLLAVRLYAVCRDKLLTPGAVCASSTLETEPQPLIPESALVSPMSRDQLLLDLAYLLNCLAQDCTGEAKGEMTMLCERLGGSMVNDVGSEIQRKVEDARRLLLATQPDRISAAVLIWQCYVMAQAQWPDFPS